MKRVAVVFSLLLMFPAAMFAAGTTQRVLVATRRPAPEALQRMRGDNFDPGERLRGTFTSVNGFVADLDQSEIATLRQSPDVLYIEPDPERHAFSSANVLQPRPAATTTPLPQIVPYGISLVDAPSAWVAGRGANINVVVIDTGIDYHHPELAGIFAGGMNELTGTTDPLDDNGHGTHVAGTIAAADNAIGVVGVAPQVRLWAVKVLDSNGSGSGSNVVQALDWIMQKKTEQGGNWIASLSLGSCFPSSLERSAFANATAAGILVFAAAGNHDPTRPDLCTTSSDTSNSYAVSYPAAYPGVNAVAAVDSTSTAANFSNFGPQVTISAPGVDVLSTFPVGTGTLSLVTPTGANSILAPPVLGSPAKDVSGAYVFCGLGNPGDFPSSVAGKIALIKRGDLTFHDKAKNAKAAGATAVVIFNKDTSEIAWTLIGRVDSTGKPNATVCGNPATASQCHDDPADLAFDWPLTVGISLADGQALVDQPKASLSVDYRANDDYEVLSGTSMATPHAAGVAALVWSLAPGATADAVRQAIISTAHDLGDPGVDNVYGNGLIDAAAAGKALNPSAFNPQPTKPAGRIPGRRGH